MTIDVFSICYNEKILLPYFLRHYSKFVRKIVVYDNMSDDGSVDIMKNAGVNIVKIDTNGNYIGEDKLMDIKNNCWKGSDADWVIVCDMDEFVYHKDIFTYLTNTPYNHIFCRGYEMMSEKLPTTSGQIYDEINLGYPTDEFISYNVFPYWKSNYSKAVLFKPSDIKEIGYGPGAHYSIPIGNVISNVECIPHGNTILNGNDIMYPKIKDDIKLLHYKYISRQYLIDKNKTSKACSTFAQFGEQEINKQYDSWLQFCKKVI